MTDNGRMRKVSVVFSLATALIIFAHTTSANSLNNDEEYIGRRRREWHRDGRRRLLIDDALKARHNGIDPLERSAHTGFDTSFMPLMQSPCRPETDGYFGGTHGSPVELRYGIRIEATSLAPIKAIVESIKEKIIDEVLSNSFPAICGYREHLELAQANGYKFGKIEGLNEETCRPDADKLNHCGVYVGHMLVFGKEGDKAAMDVLSLVDQILNADDPTNIHNELIGLSSVPELAQLQGHPVPGALEHKYRVSNLGMAGIAVTIILLSAGLVWYIIFFRKGSQLMRKSDSTTSTCGPDGLGCTSGCSSSGSWFPRRPGGRGNRRVGMEVSTPNSSGGADGEESKPFNPTRKTESVKFGTSSMLLLTDGRPAEIEFHPNDSSTDLNENDTCSGSNSTGSHHLLPSPKPSSRRSDGLV